jgi:hypothetical protein
MDNNFVNWEIQNAEGWAKRLNREGLFDQAAQAQGWADKVRKRFSALTSTEQDPQYRVL